MLLLCSCSSSACKSDQNSLREEWGAAITGSQLAKRNLYALGRCPQGVSPSIFSTNPAWHCTQLTAANRDVRAPTWPKFPGDFVARLAIFRTIAVGTRVAAPGVREYVRIPAGAARAPEHSWPGRGLRQPSPTPGDTCDYHLKNGPNLLKLQVRCLVPHVHAVWQCG